jgi:diguanylate cyclase (GGDEF)-like protein/PAS domain S-box-containing protein
MPESSAPAEATSLRLAAAVAESVADVVIAYEPDGTIAWASPSLTPVLGWDPAKVIGTRLRIATDEDAAKAAEISAEAMSSGAQTARARLRSRRADGKIIWTDTHSRLIRDPSGTVTWIVASIRDVTDDVEWQRQALEAEQHFGLAMEHSAVGMARVAPEGHFLTVNGALCDMLKRDAATLMSSTWQELTHPQDVEIDQGLVNELLAGDRDSYRLRKRYLCPDGSVVWGDLSVAAVRDSVGKVSCFISQIIDVTEKVTSAERYRLLAEHGTDVVSTSSHDCTMEWLSPSVEQLLGWPAGDLIGTSFLAYLHAEDHPLVAAAHDRVLNGEAARFEVRMRTRERGDRWVNVVLTPILGEGPDVIGCIARWRDVQSEHEAREELEASERRFRMMVENASDVVYSAGGDRRVTWVAPAVTQTLGWSPDELLGVDLVDLLHPDDRGRSERVIAHVLAGDAAPITEGDAVARVRTRSNEYRWMSVKLTRWADEPGDPMGIVGGLTLVDDLMEQRLRAQADEERIQSLLDTMLEPFTLLAAERDDSGTIVDFVIAEANHSALDVYEMTHDELVGQRFSVLHPAAMTTGLFAMYAAVVDGGEPLSLNDLAYPWEPRGGQVMRFDVRAVKAGEAVSQTWRDVSERFAVSELIARSEEHFRLLAENSTDVVLQDLGGIVQWVSPSLTACLGWDSSDWIGRSVRGFAHPGDAGRFDEIQPRTEASESTITTLRLRGKNGTYHWVEIHAGRYADDQGSSHGFVASFRVVDREVAARDALAAAEEEFRLIAQNSTDVVWHARNGQIAWISPSVSAVLGGEPAAWIGVDIAKILHPDDLPAHLASLSEAAPGSASVVRARLRASDGTYHWIDANTGSFINAQGVEDGVIASFRVVDDLVAAEEELAYYARFDALTGLMNRREIFHKLRGISGGNREPGDVTAMLFCDIDRFKDVNDAYGHAAGDEVLRRLAERISASVRSDDAAARIGGDEFLVVLTGTHSLDEAVAVAEKIRDAAAVSVSVDHAQVVTSLSIGVALMRQGESIGDLIAHADEALYAAKRAGRNQVVTIA